MSDVKLSQGFPLSVATRTDVGLLRANNEDTCGRFWQDDGSLLAIVCDGMGGHQAGEVASGLAVDVLREFMSTDRRPVPERIAAGLIEANEAVVTEGEVSDLKGMGTTATVVQIHGDEFYYGFVGDSRVYHIRDGMLLWRTRDHTRIQSLIDAGQLDASAARSHPESGMLTRALGHRKMANGKPLVAEVAADPVRLATGDTLVLSSDGLHDLVDDHEIAELVAGKTARASADALVALALKRGGHDNVTVAVVVAGERASAFDADALATPVMQTPTDMGGAAASSTPYDDQTSMFSRDTAGHGHAPAQPSAPEADLPLRPAPAPPAQEPVASEPGGSTAMIWVGLAAVAMVMGLIIGVVVLFVLS